MAQISDVLLFHFNGCSHSLSSTPTPHFRLSYNTNLFSIPLEYLAGEHGKVGHGGEGADEDGRKVVPAEIRVSHLSVFRIILADSGVGLGVPQSSNMGDRGTYFLVAFALLAREMKMMVDTKRIRKVIVMALTPVMVVHADGARFSVIHQTLPWSVATHSPNLQYPHIQPESVARHPLPVSTLRSKS